MQKWKRAIKVNSLIEKKLNFKILLIIDKKTKKVILSKKEGEI